ncbi:MAG: AAA family ATPase [Coriobacteriales bacterium]|jgi:nitric oxide reductase NorQ protein
MGDEGADASTGVLGSLERQGVSGRVIDGIARFRREHPTPEGLAGRVPRTSGRYLGRRVWEQAATALLCGCNLLLCGPKATGKNVLARDLACAFGRPQWDVSFHIDMDASTMIGTDTYADGRVSFRPGPIARCAELGGFGVLDEINMARSEALAVLHATLDFRRTIDVPGYDLIRLDDATRFIATMNVGYAGTRELNDALVSRFVVVDMPALDVDGLRDLLLQEHPDLTPEAAHQLAELFCEIRSKCSAGEISEKALDLRGLIDSVALMRAGLPPVEALEVCLVNKTFDEYERGLVSDVIAARIPRSVKRGRLFV